MDIPVVRTESGAVYYYLIDAALAHGHANTIPGDLEVQPGDLAVLETKLHKPVRFVEHQ